MKTHIAVVVLLVLFDLASGYAATTVPCEILSPVLEDKGSVMMATAPNGNSYPVFQTAARDPLVEKVRSQLDSSFAQQVLRLDRYARNLLAAQRPTHASVEEWLTAPMYLLMSTEEGGFPRFGFWMEDAPGKRRLVLAGYVDLVITERSLESGNFEEIFPHELGHLILRALTGGVGSGLSRKMHQSMTITDYPTAFDEGYAEHFQPLARDVTHNAYLRKLDSGTGATDLELLWLSAADGQVRTDGVKHNIFVHRKSVPQAALDSHPDLYRLFVEAETSTAFVPTQLKTGQEMLASEGVLATLFYRMVNDDQMRNRYREASFYEPFLGSHSNSENAITPYENANLKLFAAMAKLRNGDQRRPQIVALVEQYAKMFPDEAKRIYSVFIETTWGATASHQLALALETAASDGGRGDIASFRKDRPFQLLDSTISEVVNGKQALDESLGPELWIVNSEFKIAPAVWSVDRSLPLTINLNTATEAELMTIPGINLDIARRIVTARHERGFLRSIDESGTIIPPDVSSRLKSMAEQIERLGPYQRN